VWVVDDDRLIRDLCQTIFEARKISYKIFASPEKVLNEPYSPGVETILMDIRMPKMNGFTLNKELRKKIDSKKTKIVAFTAQALPEEQSIILARGFDGILLKPFREMDLLHVLGVSTTQKTTDISNRGFDTEHRNPEILQSLRQETAADILQLQEYFESRDTGNMSLIFHRLAGRISQFGGSRLAIALRKKEIDTRADEVPTLEQLSEIIGEIEAFLKTL
jgi:CheY-like chemotaxis protein